MEETVNERLYKFIKQYCGFVRNFAETLNMNETTLSNKLRGDRKLDLELIIEILVKYRDLSADWLLLGEGAMLRSTEDDKQKPQNELPAEINAYVEILKEQLAEEKERSRQYWTMIQKIVDK